MKVFVSSTYKDLKAHRDAVNHVLARMKLGISAMEFFGSRTDEALPACLREIEECDLFVGIYAWRYGWLPREADVSITESEFDYAMELGKPCLCYVIDEDHPWPPSLVDPPGSQPGNLLAAFKEKVGRRVRSTFTTPEDLARQVAADLARETSPHGLARLSEGTHRWRAYCSRLITELELDKESTLHYVNLEASAGDTTRFDLEERFFAWLSQPAEGVLAILGDFGSGKTTVCRYLCHRIASSWEAEPPPFIPVLIPLGHYRSTASLFDMLTAELRRLNAPVDDLPMQRVVLFLDGLDEQAHRFSSEEADRRLLEVQGTLPRESKIVLTCRTHFFRDRVAESTSLFKRNVLSTGLRPGPAETIPIIYISPFSPEQKEVYLRKSQGPQWREAAATIEGIYDLKDLSARPILLNLITNLLPELRGAEGRVGQARLYQIAVESWLERERWRGIEPDEVRRFLESLAFALIKQAEAQNVHHQKLEAHVRKHFRKRILSAIDLEAWAGMVRTSLFLNRDAEGNYGFMHRSFLEYFLAQKIIRCAHERTFKELESIRYSHYVSRETHHFIGNLIPGEHTIDIYSMLAAVDQFPSCASIAAHTINNTKLTPAVDKNSEIFRRILAAFPRSRALPVLRACVWVMRKAGSREAIPALLDYFHDHRGDLLAVEVLEAIVELGDERDIPALTALRDQIMDAVQFLTRLPVPAVPPKEYHQRDLEKYKEQLKAGDLSKITPGSMLIAILDAPRKHMWGINCQQVDEAISTIIHRHRAATLPPPGNPASGSGGAASAVRPWSS